MRSVPKLLFLCREYITYSFITKTNIAQYILGRIILLR